MAAPRGMTPLSALASWAVLTLACVAAYIEDEFISMILSGACVVTFLLLLHNMFRPAPPKLQPPSHQQPPSKGVPTAPPPTQPLAEPPLPLPRGVPTAPPPRQPLAEPPLPRGVPTAPPPRQPLAEPPLPRGVTAAPPPRQPLAEPPLPRGVNAASRELATQVQNLLDADAEPREECAERIVALCDRAQRSKHLDALPREAWHALERLRRLNRGLISSDKVRLEAAQQDRELVPWIAASLKAALLGEKPPAEIRPAREAPAINSTLADVIQAAHDALIRDDAEVLAMRAHVKGLKKVTPSVAQKLLRSVQRRMQAEAYRFILENVQLDKRYSTPEGKDAFMHSVCMGIASKQVYDGEFPPRGPAAAPPPAKAGRAPVGAGVVDPSERNTAKPKNYRVAILIEHKGKILAAIDSVDDDSKKANLAALAQRIDAQIAVELAGGSTPRTELERNLSLWSEGDDRGGGGGNK